MTVIASVRSGAVTVLEAVKAANPTLLGQISSARPASFQLGLPHAYVGDQRWSLLHDMGLRNWTGQAQVVLVFASWDNEEQQAQADALTQVVMDAFSDSPHFADPNSVAEPVAVSVGTELDVAGISYPAVAITVGKILFKEGR